VEQYIKNQGKQNVDGNLKLW